MSEAESCTTWAYRKRHLSVALTPDDHYGGAKTGPTLCSSTGNPAYAYDQAAMDTVSLRYSNRPQKKRIADLPPCTKCAKAVRS